MTALMHQDALLPTDVVPATPDLAAGTGILVTGATGFLGRCVIRELLQRSGGKVLCLVRARDTAHAEARLLTSLAAVGVDAAAHAGRLTALPGAVEAPQLGLSDAAYAELALAVGSILHCAANVNWARGYRRLRSTNVSGTQAVIRLACTGPVKRIVYSSTIAVCYTQACGHDVDETTDMLPYVEHMPLGYAQTKCVSESLLREAARRGVPVSVIRPALIAGDSETGQANHQDMICALMQGCIASGAAIELDWQLDCVPVDHVARVLAALADCRRPGWEVLHLVNEKSRPWREVVLWMNLYGYPVALVEHSEWLLRAFARGTAAPTLFGYRRFFGAIGRRSETSAPYETYLEHAQVRVSSDATRATLTQLGLSVPALDASLMDRYLSYYVRAGLIPAAARRPLVSAAAGSAADRVAAAMGSRLAEQDLRLTAIRKRPFESRNGIFNEVAAARLGQDIGMDRYQVRVTDSCGRRAHSLDVLLKTKPSDAMMEDLLVEVATLCDPQLGALFHAFRGDLGISGCHERELAMYELAEPRLDPFLPRLLGTDRDASRQTWTVAMEYLPEAEQVNVASDAWTIRQLGRVLHSAGVIHGSWYLQDDRLDALPWLSQPVSRARMLEMTPLWNALAAYARRFSPWLHDGVPAMQQNIIDTLGSWWPELRRLPQTLVHNDFNPRNLILRRRRGSVNPLIFDWELAAIGVPQHDVAELLCFTLPEGCDEDALMDLLDVHRTALQSAAGVPVSRRDVVTGFNLSLRYLMLYRLPFYALMHRFRHQAFLARVMGNWVRLSTLGIGLTDRLLQGSAGATGHDHQQFVTELSGGLD